jgi:hypothetical protein
VSRALLPDNADVEFAAGNSDENANDGSHRLINAVHFHMDFKFPSTRLTGR